ncbi:MAG: tRNA preQ1(34) S-adenosylmethionine ribosyltransferase-isomerase QueA [Bacteriovoracaceae bacterium]|jgi:S-adenosylmethionine:tRNA ribosyltransferase-isomerase|nr:tRNA preQ1(34) S-adenosylmethionine ribosyltransferase-isomerase QueA [Bacteriovoracaceae bacterium]
MTQENRPVHIPEDLKLSSYHFDLPERLIAMRPTEKRDQCRLLVYNAKKDMIKHAKFKDLHHYLPDNSLLVRNQTKVLPCRLLGQKSTGAKCEVFILGPFGGMSIQNVLIKSSAKKKLGDDFIFSNQLSGKIIEINKDRTFQLQFNLEGTAFENVLDEIAKIPIPPYIRNGESDKRDIDDYQTIYAKVPGSVAAPTAGLHFTNEVMDNLKSKNIATANVTLHVGMGTFAPVNTEDLRNHIMHSEKFFVEKEELEKLNNKNERIAVGTTSLRVLETIYNGNEFKQRVEGVDETNIFLYPGKEVKSIKGMITNFHLPESSLLMLVSALIGRVKTLELYQEAINKKYRFFSYGDAMLILR